ncbi:MAG: purine-nucleoside phosphorylase [Thermodesulfobacteriota bacterium]
MDSDIFSYRLQVEKAVAYLGKRIRETPEIVISIGTGLGFLVDRVESSLVIPYEEVPCFPQATVTSHAGNLVFGKLAGRAVVVLQGRCHYYEGYSTRELTLPLRVMALLGAKTLVVANAAGGLNPAIGAGSLMVIRDHINFIPDNPLRGTNIDEWGPRFPDLSDAYDKELLGLARCGAERLGFADVAVGVYGAVPGPSLETPAETRYLHDCGIDAVGMSTVPEVIVAKHASMRVLGVSVIANVNDPDNFQPIILEDVIARTGQVVGQLTKMIAEIIPEF